MTDATLAAPAPPAVEPEHEPAEVLRRLSQIDILRALPPEEMHALVPHVDFVHLAPGTELMRLGDPGDSMFFIESGTARVERPGQEPVFVGPGSVVGEAALLTGAPRSATVTAETECTVWVIAKHYFDQLLEHSPALKLALEQVMAARRHARPLELPSHHWWIATALHALETRARGMPLWQRAMAVGLVLWVLIFFNHRMEWIPESRWELGFALLELLTGIFIVQGACEAFVQAVERLGARLHWDGFISGTVGSLVSTLPEFVVIAFLVTIAPLAAFVTATVTIFNNALVFSIYGFFLPKDRRGVFAMPRSLSMAGGEILIAGAAVSLIIGIVMLVLRLGTVQTAIEGFDLVGIGVVMVAIYGYYLLTLTRYYGEGKDDEESLPVDPERLGHDVDWEGIITLFVLGTLGAYAAGEMIGSFADTALGRLGLPTIPTAAALAFFAGISEYIIVYKSHRRGELGIALSNTFGGLTQVMFMLLPFTLILIGGLGLLGAGEQFVIPLNAVTMLLVLLLYPLFHALHQYVQQEKSLSNLGAAAMTGIYLLLLYFLFTSPS